MKRIIYILFFAFAVISAKENKAVQAQIKTTQIIIDDANLLPSMTTTAAFIDVKRVYGSDLQYRYYYKTGNPTGARTQEFIYKHYVILGTTPAGGYWTTIKAFIEAENVMGLDSVVKLIGYAKYTPINTRIVADSLRLVSETSRATGIENGKANVSYANSLSNRATSDSIRLVNEISRATAAEATKQPIGSYLTSEIDPMYIAAGEKLTNKSNTFVVGSTDAVKYPTLKYIADALASVVLPTVSAGANSGITVVKTGSDYALSQVTPTYNNSPGRALTTAFRPSITRPTRVSYSVSILTTLSLLNLNSSGTVALQISQDNATWTTINTAGITRTLSVSITVGLNDTSLLNVAGEIPANWYCRLLPTTSGGATVSMSSGQEVTY